MKKHNLYSFISRTALIIALAAPHSASAAQSSDAQPIAIQAVTNALTHAGLTSEDYLISVNPLDGSDKLLVLVETKKDIASSHIAELRGRLLAELEAQKIPFGKLRIRRAPDVRPQAPVQIRIRSRSITRPQTTFPQGSNIAPGPPTHEMERSAVTAAPASPTPSVADLAASMRLILILGFIALGVLGLAVALAFQIGQRLETKRAPRPPERQNHTQSSTVFASYDTDPALERTIKTLEKQIATLARSHPTLPEVVIKYWAKRPEKTQHIAVMLEVLVNSGIILNDEKTKAALRKMTESQDFFSTDATGEERRAILNEIYWFHISKAFNNDLGAAPTLEDRTRANPNQFRNS